MLIRLKAGALTAGQIVIADWRGDALPKEPNKRRPAVVVDEDALFGPSYPNSILVPLTNDATLIIRELAVEIVPSPENGCSKVCWAASHLAAATSKLRITPTPSRVSDAQLRSIRERIALAIGLDI